MPSKVATTERKRVRAEVYAANGEGSCPYQDGTRAARVWSTTMRHYWNMEAMMGEMAEVYGEFRSTPPEDT